MLLNSFLFKYITKFYLFLWCKDEFSAAITTRSFGNQYFLIIFLIIMNVTS